MNDLIVSKENKSSWNKVFNSYFATDNLDYFKVPLSASFENLTQYQDTTIIPEFFAASVIYIPEELYKSLPTIKIKKDPFESDKESFVVYDSKVVESIQVNTYSKLESSSELSNKDIENVKNKTTDRSILCSKIVSVPQERVLVDYSIKTE